MRAYVMLMAAVCVALGCQGRLPATDAGLDAGVDAAAGPVGQGSAPRGALVIDEVAPRPADGPDWIELVNRTDEAVDLCDYFVTDSLDRLDHYAPLGEVAPPGECPPRLLAAGAYALVFADGAAPEDPPRADAIAAGDIAAGDIAAGDIAADIVIGHAPFRLGDADEVHVVTATGLAEDSLIYLYPTGVQPGASLARSPDAAGLFYPAPPTPGEANPPDLDAPDGAAAGSRAEARR